MVFLVRRQGVLDGKQAGPGHGLSSGKRDMIFMDAAGCGMGSRFLPGPPGKGMAVCPGYFHLSTEVCGVLLRCLHRTQEEHSVRKCADERGRERQDTEAGRSGSIE